jgi:ElaB/YqjD/DUF883 family membrane-anchored ribosome-binding protein
MSTGFWGSRADAEAALSEQLAALQKELKALRRQAEAQGRKSYNEARDQASDFMDELRVQMADAGEKFGRGARQARDAARENPATAAAVGLVAVGLMALLLGRSRR